MTIKLQKYIDWSRLILMYFTEDCNKREEIFNVITYDIPPEQLEEYLF